MRSLTVRYDPVAKAAYIWIGDDAGQVSDRTVIVGADQDVAYDLNRDGDCFGVEILNVSEPVLKPYDSTARLVQDVQTDKEML